MVYFLETKLVKNKALFFSLNQVFGINQFQSFLICKKLGLSCNCTLSILTSDQVAQLIKFIENLNLLINKNLKKSNIILATKLIQIKTYKGLRKLRGLPLRGQRTHTNAKTAAKNMHAF